MSTKEPKPIAPPPSSHRSWLKTVVYICGGLILATLLLICIWPSMG